MKRRNERVFLYLKIYENDKLITFRTAAVSGMNILKYVRDKAVNNSP
jgi:hypothetical protein